MTTARRKFSQEFRDELCREVIGASKPVRDVAEVCGIGTGKELAGRCYIRSPFGAGRKPLRTTGPPR